MTEETATAREASPVRALVEDQIAMALETSVAPARIAMAQAAVAAQARIIMAPAALEVVILFARRVTISHPEAAVVSTLARVA